MQWLVLLHQNKGNHSCRYCWVPCDYDRLRFIVKEKKSLFTPANDIQKALAHIPIVADCAHSFGASYKGIPTGNVADFSSFPSTQ